MNSPLSPLSLSLLLKAATALGAKNMFSCFIFFLLIIRIIVPILHKTEQINHNLVYEMIRIYNVEVNGLKLPINNSFVFKDINFINKTV